MNAEGVASQRRERSGNYELYQVFLFKVNLNIVKFVLYRKKYSFSEQKKLILYGNIVPLKDNEEIAGLIAPDACVRPECVGAVH